MVVSVGLKFAGCRMEEDFPRRFLKDMASPGPTREQLPAVVVVVVVVFIFRVSITKILFIVRKSH